jgi:hypothetical protein
VKEHEESMGGVFRRCMLGLVIFELQGSVREGSRVCESLTSMLKSLRGHEEATPFSSSNVGPLLF